ncbi:MAG: addiction module protein [Planctomycetes bacterium]|nr:addiction module protein [Planctomycetota bacterium]
MSRVLEDISSEALALPPKDRALLARHLLASLDEEPEEDVEELRYAEAERRHQEFREGKAKMLPAAEVFARVRRSLR